MGIQIEIDSFDELHPWILWITRALGLPSGGTPPEPYWRPLETWRRVLRTMYFVGRASVWLPSEEEYIVKQASEWLLLQEEYQRRSRGWALGPEHNS